MDKSGKILIMDDEEMIKDFLSVLLEDLGYDSEFSSDGIETIQKYKMAMENKEPFDVVILDLTIPGGMGGKEALDEIRKFDPNIKAIVSSGYSDDPIMANYEDHGFKAVVTKPYKIEDLSETISNLMNRENFFVNSL